MPRRSSGTPPRAGSVQAQFEARYDRSAGHALARTVSDTQAGMDAARAVVARQSTGMNADQAREQAKFATKQAAVQVTTGAAQGFEHMAEAWKEKAQSIEEGPRGGRFYMSSTGTKVYLGKDK